MKQQTFAFQPKSKPSVLKLTRDYDAANLACAAVIVADPTLWGGRDSFGYRWGLTVQERLQPAIRIAA